MTKSLGCLLGLGVLTTVGLGVGGWLKWQWTFSILWLVLGITISAFGLKRWMGARRRDPRRGRYIVLVVVGLILIGLAARVSGLLDRWVHWGLNLPWTWLIARSVTLSLLVAIVGAFVLAKRRRGVLIRVVFLFFAFKVGLVFAALSVVDRPERRDLVLELKNDSGFQTWVADDVSIEAYQESLERRILECTELGAMFRATFLESVPTREWLALQVCSGLYQDLVLTTESGDGAHLELPEIELGIHERSLVERLRADGGERFERLSKGMGRVFDASKFLLLFTTMVAGSWVHLVCYLLFAFCVTQLHHEGDELPAGNDIDPAIEKQLIKTGILQQVMTARDSISQLGFIGTLLGLSSAMSRLGDGDPVGAVLERPGITPQLASSLGLAFNTTLVALLLTVALSWVNSKRAAHHAYWRAILRRLREMEGGAAG